MKRSKGGEQPKRSAISKAQTYEEIGAYWDTHDLGNVGEPTRAAVFDVAIKRRRFLVAVDPGILREVRRCAATRGLTPESLVNLWLKEKLAG
ncbi:hypothetical protein KF840_02090 [bacterium]|nr:hypothetical protein [bacterium]